jgi:predicted secreted protein
LDLGLGTICRVDEVEELHEKHRLGLEASLVVVVRDNEEDILENGNEEALEESVRSSDIRLISNIVNELQAHIETGTFDVTVVVLESPRTGVNDELELVVVKLEKGWRTLALYSSCWL